MKTMTTRQWLCAILAVGLAARALACWKLTQWGPGGAIPDIDYYESMAEGLAREGRLLDLKGLPSAVREPGYPILLAAVYRATGPSYRAAQLLNCALGMLALLAIFVLGSAVFGETTALLATAIAAVYPQFLFYTAQIRRECLLVFLSTMTAWFALKAWREPSPRALLKAGLVAALGPLTSSPFLAGGACIAWIFRRRGAGLYLAALVGLYALWPARNFLTFGRLVAGVVGGGNHVYMGIAIPNDVAGTPEEEAFVKNDPVVAAGAELADDFARDRHYYRATFDWIKKHPLSYVNLMIQSGLKLWRLYPYPRAYGHSYRMIFWTSLLSDGWIIPLGLLGLYLARSRPETAIFNAMLLGVTLAYMLFWSIVRYRLPLMPFVILYAAHALRLLWTHRPGAFSRA